MKKLLTILLGVLMLFSLVGCGKKEENNNSSNTNTNNQEQLIPEPPTAANTYADFVAAANDTELELLMSVQAHESWWDGKVTVYAQDDNGGYLVYEMLADEATANALTPGTLIRVKGYKSEWSGEIELVDATCEIIVGAYDGKVYDAEDLTSLIGNNDELAKHMNAKAAFKNLTVVSYDAMTSDSDGYLNVTDANGTAITFVVRRYLTPEGSDVANAVAALAAGDVIDLTSFLYWYEGPQARIIEVVKH